MSVRGGPSRPAVGEEPRDPAFFEEGDGTRGRPLVIVVEAPRQVPARGVGRDEEARRPDHGVRHAGEDHPRSPPSASSGWPTTSCQKTEAAAAERRRPCSRRAAGRRQPAARRRRARARAHPQRLRTPPPTGTRTARPVTRRTSPVATRRDAEPQRTRARDVTTPPVSRGHGDRKRQGEAARVGEGAGDRRGEAGCPLLLAGLGGRAGGGAAFGRALKRTAAAHTARGVADDLAQGFGASPSRASAASRSRALFGQPCLAHPKADG